MGTPGLSIQITLTSAFPTLTLVFNEQLLGVDSCEYRYEKKKREKKMMLRRFLRRCSSRGSNNTLRVDCHYRLPQILQLKYYNRTITSSRILFCSNRDINTNSTNRGGNITY